MVVDEPAAAEIVSPVPEIGENEIKLIEQLIPNAQDVGIGYILFPDAQAANAAGIHPGEVLQVARGRHLVYWA